ncbi:glycosyltransferase family 2 protein [Microvirga arabica]|nr:glycosyltransferase family 2 protein [Microvirga arabica]
MTSVAVVIPTYRAKATILSVLSMIGPEVERIYVVDDACPEQTGKFVSAHCTDPRVHVLHNEINQGVGGATLAGYQAAVADNATVIVKLDADAQMDPDLIPFFVQPILSGQADYTKGNRFFDAISLSSMPRVRIFGNAVLSLMTKISTGYWSNVDPSNGYTAIHARLVPLLPIDRISKRFFFETDMLFYLGLLRAVVIDIPIVAHYGDEESNLKIKSVLLPFTWAHCTRFFRRVALNYFVRDFSFASLCLLAGVPLFIFGLIYGVANWIAHLGSMAPTPTGTIMIATLSVLLGMQFLLFFFSADIAAAPRRPLHLLLSTEVVRPLKQFAGREKVDCTTSSKDP